MAVLTASDIERLRLEAQRWMAFENALMKQAGFQSTATFNGRAAGQMLGEIELLKQENARLKAQIKAGAV